MGERSASILTALGRNQANRWAAKQDREAMAWSVLLHRAASVNTGLLGGLASNQPTHLPLLQLALVVGMEVNRDSKGISTQQVQVQVQRRW